MRITQFDSTEIQEANLTKKIPTQWCICKSKFHQLMFMLHLWSFKMKTKNIKHPTDTLKDEDQKLEILCMKVFANTFIKVDWKLHKLCFEILCKWKIKTYWHSASSLDQVAPCKHTHQRKGLKATKATPRRKIRGMGIMSWHTNVGDNRQRGVYSDLSELNMSFP